MAPVCMLSTAQHAPLGMAEGRESGGRKVASLFPPRHSSVSLTSMRVHVRHPPHLAQLSLACAFPCACGPPRSGGRSARRARCVVRGLLPGSGSPLLRRGRTRALLGCWARFCVACLYGLVCFAGTGSMQLRRAWRYNGEGPHASRHKVAIMIGHAQLRLWTPSGQQWQGTWLLSFPLSHSLTSIDTLTDAALPYAIRYRMQSSAALARPYAMRQTSRCPRH